METYKPIQCGDYDILEVICMDAYDVEVITSTDTHNGVATTIEKKHDGEYLVLKTNGADTASVRADNIVKINVLTRPCRFTTYDFG